MDARTGAWPIDHHVAHLDQAIGACDDSLRFSAQSQNPNDALAGQIIRAVCRQLRARPFADADAPIIDRQGR